VTACSQGKTIKVCSLHNSKALLALLGVPCSQWVGFTVCVTTTGTTQFALPPPLPTGWTPISPMCCAVHLLWSPSPLSFSLLHAPD